MKALSVKQPWANMIASGIKTIEFRQWTTRYRGPILIVVAKKLRTESAGKAIAIAWLKNCRLAVPGDELMAYHPVFNGAWAWEFSMITKIRMPFEIRGRQGLFNVDYDPKVSDLKLVY